jgi:DNA-directed RNA polymerase
MEKKFKIFATLTKSFDIHHNDNNIHLLASTVAVVGNVDLTQILEQITIRDIRSKKSLIIEVTESSNDINVDFDFDDFLKETIVQYQSKEVTLNEYGIEKRFENEMISYIRINFDYFVMLINTSENSNLLCDLFKIDYEDKKEEEQLYNQCLFVFNNITWSNIVLKLKINNINVSGGSPSTRHTLSTLDVSLIYYLNLITNFNIELILKIVYLSYSQCKNILSNSISMSLYKKYIDNFDEILVTNPNLLNEKLLSITNSDYESDSNNRSIMLNNLLISRQTIIRVIALHYKKVLISKLEAEIKIQKDLLYEYQKKYSAPIVAMSRKERKLEKKIINKNLVNFDSNEYNKKINEYELKINNLVNSLSDNKTKFTNIVENLKKINMKDLMIEFDKYSKNIKIDVNSINSANKKFKKYKKIKGFDSNNMTRQYSTWYSSHPVSRYHTMVQIRRNMSTTTNKTTKIIGKVYSTISNSKTVRNRLEKLTTIFKPGTPFFIEMYKILTEDKLNEVTQLKIERFLLNQGKLLFEVNIEKNMKRFLSGGVGGVGGVIDWELITILINSRNDFNKLINNYKVKIKGDIYSMALHENVYGKKDDIVKYIFLNTSTDFIISISIGRVLRVISYHNFININNNKYLDVSIELGKEIIENFLVNTYQNQKDKNLSLESPPGSEDENDDKKNINFFNWKNNNKEWVDTIEDSTLQFKIGNMLVNFLCELELLDWEIKTIEKKKVNITIPGKKIIQLIGNSNNKGNGKIIILPKKLPMVCKPKLYKWKKGKYIQLGGYLLNGEEKTDEIILPNYELKSKTTFADENIICDIVNQINSVSFRINKEVLNFILNNNSIYNFFIDMNYTHPLIFKDKLYSKERKELESFCSKRYLEQNILGLALLYADVPQFYLNTGLDYRGRLYCLTEYLNYQGIELAKALLEFSQGVKVYLSDQLAIDYLKIYGANTFGNKLDKKSFNDRIDWVNQNIENIVNFENGILLSQSENKLLFLAFCFEFRKYMQALKRDGGEQEYFISHLGIQLDASCNGFQHLILMIDEIKLAKELNLAPAKWSDTPKDFYNFISLKAKDFFLKNLEKEFKKSGTLTPEEIISYEKLYKLDIHRTLVKKAVMTIPYNATTFTIIDYIKEEFNQKINPNYKKDESGGGEEVKEDLFIYILKKDKNIVFSEFDFRILSKVLNKIIFVDYPKLNELVKYLKQISNISNKLEIPIPWVLPTGLVVNQQFYKTKTLKVKPFLYTNNLLNLNIMIKDQYNNSKQRLALMPNLIHSLDGASLGLVINNYFKENENKNFAAIHDCFIVPCNKVDRLNKLIKSAYCVIYTDKNYLFKFNENFFNSIKLFYGEKNVNFDENNNTLEVITKKGIVKEYYPSLSNIIDSTISKIDISESEYLIS